MVSDEEVRRAMTLTRASNNGVATWPFWVRDAGANVQAKFLAQASPYLPRAMQLTRCLSADELKSPQAFIVEKAGADDLLAAIRSLVKAKAKPAPAAQTLSAMWGVAQQTRHVQCTALNFAHATQFVSPDIDSPQVDITRSDRGEKHQGHHTLHRIYMMLAFALLGARGKPDQAKDQNIAALLVAPQGKILGWAVNQKSKHPMLHAETTLVLDWVTATGGAVPKGSRVYTTLQSCKMCAAVLMDTVKDVFVYYGQYDAGDHARGTALATANKEAPLPLDIMLGPKSDSMDAPPRGMAERLIVDWSTKKESTESSIQKTAWAFLRSEALPSFKKARLGLRQKIEQYLFDAKQDKNPNVAKVLEHVVSYGVALEVSIGIAQAHPWVKKLKLFEGYSFT
jgi:tRNA(Arg) A34 adenosine deaminase TadA